MRVLIYQKEKQTYKIEVYGHLPSIECAFFSGAFQYLYCILLNEYHTCTLIQSKLGIEDVQTLSNFGINSVTKYALEYFKHFCNMLKEQHNVKMEVINGD